MMSDTYLVALLSSLERYKLPAHHIHHYCSCTFLRPIKLTLKLLALSACAFVTAILAGCWSGGSSESREVSDGVPPSLNWQSRLPDGGPSIFRRTPGAAPQLENIAPWEAEPILISGAYAYRQGEFIYQDWIYDDLGAATDAASITGQRTGMTGQSGSIHYPTDADMYAYNAADLVEFRVRAGRDETHFRVTLNTLARDPEKTAFTLALGESSEIVSYPFSANVSGPADYFLTVHGAQGIFTDREGNVLGTVDVNVDTWRYQYTVSIPATLWSPGTAVISMALGVGLWDVVNGQYSVPQESADEDTPGGAGSGPAAAFFNVAFRNEPYGDNAYFEAAQAEGLGQGDMRGFYVDVDFEKLISRVGDESMVPKTGPISRIFASRHTLCEVSVETSPIGISLDPSNLTPLNAEPCPDGMRGRGVDAKDVAIHFLGELQPYVVQVPEYQGKPYGMALILHGGGGVYTEMIGTNLAEMIMNRGTGSVQLTPAQRGPSTESRGYGMADIFEAWVDVARWYPLDPTLNVMSGVSQGGHGLLRIASYWPDLFARIFPIVGVMDDDKVRSLRHVEVMAWNAIADELVPVHTVESQAKRMLDAGNRFEIRYFSADHLTLGSFSGVESAIAWLGEHRPPTSPHRVSYTLDSSASQPNIGIEVGKAYWVRDMIADEESMFGFVEAIRHNAGFEEPVVSGLKLGMGSETGRTLGAETDVILAFRSEYQDWGERGVQPVLAEDKLSLFLENIRSLSIDIAKAQLTCDVILEVTTNLPTRISLDGCNRVVIFNN